MNLIKYNVIGYVLDRETTKWKGRLITLNANDTNIGYKCLEMFDKIEDNETIYMRVFKNE